MKTLNLALKTFFRVLSDATFAGNIQNLLSGGTPAETDKPATLVSRRSDALSLVEALQREARLVDFVMEPLEGYSDAQVGAAARNVHRDAGKVLRRMFAPEPLRTENEGASIDVPKGFDPLQVHLTGNVTGEPPHRGTLQHQGWKAAQCDIPVWNGSAESERVVAPAEVELA